MIKRVGYGFLAIGLLCMLGSCRRMSTAYDLRSSGHEMTARVKARDHEAGTLDVQYHYKGETYLRTYEADSQFLRKHPKNAKIELVFLPNDPGGAVPIHDPSLSGAGVIVLFMVALLLLVLGAVLALRVPSPGRPSFFSKKVPDQDDDDDEAPIEAEEDDGFDPNKPHWMP